MYVCGRLTVSGLKDEVRGLILKDRLDTPAETLRKSSKEHTPVYLCVSSLSFCSLYFYLLLSFPRSFGGNGCCGDEFSETVAVRLR